MLKRELSANSMELIGELGDRLLDIDLLITEIKKGDEQYSPYPPHIKELKALEVVKRLSTRSVVEVCRFLQTTNCLSRLSHSARRCLPDV